MHNTIQNNNVSIGYNFRYCAVTASTGKQHWRDCRWKSPIRIWCNSYCDTYCYNRELHLHCDACWLAVGAASVWSWWRGMQLTLLLLHCTYVISLSQKRELSKGLAFILNMSIWSTTCTLKHNQKIFFILQGFPDASDMPSMVPWCIVN